MSVTFYYIEYSHKQLVYERKQIKNKIVSWVKMSIKIKIIKQNEQYIPVYTEYESWRNFIAY